jgi:TRAP-type mannitol/chloroaromatic compound transport system permease small subunit
MSDFPAAFYTVIRAIDRFSDVTGKLISLSMLWLVASISYECFSRYLFNAPTGDRLDDGVDQPRLEK